jgi:hypothetical protein
MAKIRGLMSGGVGVGAGQPVNALRRQCVVPRWDRGRRGCDSRFVNRVMRVVGSKRCSLHSSPCRLRGSCVASAISCLWVGASVRVSCPAAASLKCGDCWCLLCGGGRLLW